MSVSGQSPRRGGGALDSPLVQHRFAWRYLVGFVHPASGCTLIDLATAVSIPLFEIELVGHLRRWLP
jgi:hypothetical protein